MKNKNWVSKQKFRKFQKNALYFFKIKRNCDYLNFSNYMFIKTFKNTYGREAIVAKFEYNFLPSLEFIKAYGADSLFCLQNWSGCKI